MELANVDMNRELFDQRTKGKWRRERLEAFACSMCDHLFIGLPDAHTLLIDGANPIEAIKYKLPGGTRCPKCKGIVQGTGQLSREPLPGELARSRWGWLVGRVNAG